MAMATAVAMLATACDDQRPASWRTSADRVTTTGLAWAAGSTVHLSDGTEIDTGAAVRFFVVAGDGVFFVPVDRKADSGSTAFADYELVFAAPGMPATGTGLVVSPDYVAASPDGRYLAAIDRTSGEKDRFGTPQATVLAFDLETGEQIIDSTLGMGDPAKDDFADGYSESEIEISAMTGTRLYVQGFGRFVFDLATGEGEEYAGLAPSRGVSTSLEREARRIRKDAAGKRVVFPLGFPR